MTKNDFWKDRVREGSVLSPIDRISEVLFGLIMVLTFTGTISVATDGRQEVRELLWAALGCNLAWGLVDAVMYWMNVLMERGHARKSMIAIQESKETGASREIMREELPPAASVLLSEGELDSLIDRIKKLPPPERRHLLTMRDLLSGLQIFLLVFLCTLPVAIPFALLPDVPTAMRASNGVALIMLFTGGYRLARYAGFRPWITALAYASIGLALVAITMALGG